MNAKQGLIILLTSSALSFYLGHKYGSAQINSFPVGQDELKTQQAGSLKDDFSSKLIHFKNSQLDARALTKNLSVDTIKIGTLVASEESLSEESEALISTYIASASEVEVYDALKLFFGNDDLLLPLNDVKQFATRLIKELGEEESEIHEDSHASLYFSTDRNFPEQAKQHFQLEGRQAMFAHIETPYGLGKGEDKYFIRWKHIESGQILLFKQKPVIKSAETNWVSYTPETSWLDGGYEVNFYRFDSALEKLASNTFYITIK